MRTSIPREIRDAFGPDEHVVLAVSGGVDSMVMLHSAAHALSQSRIVVATFDHGTGPAATAARDHVVRWCKRAGIACESESAVDTLTTEEEFRDARWRFLQAVAARRGGTIATAHTTDDQVETVFMRILRGASARGLAGLLAPSDVRRPLLRVSRTQITAYAARHRVSWVEDPSNASRRHFRNRVRLDLLPALSLAHPELRAELLVLSERAAEWRSEVDALVRRELGVRVRSSVRGVEIPMQSLRGLPREGLEIVWPAVAGLVGARLDRRAVARLAAFTERCGVGARASVAGGWEAVRARDALEFCASGQAVPAASIVSQSGGICWGTWSIRPTSAAGVDAWSAWLPSDAQLTIRSWRAGDVLVVRPGQGARQRKVKVLLSKAGVTGHERASWPVVLSGDQIVWIPGVSRSDAATVRSGRPVLAFLCEHNR